MLRESGMNELLGIQGDFRYEHLLREFGSSDAILQRLGRELSVQFITSKKFILQLMQMYVSRCGKKNTKGKILFYGTSSLNLIWEEACGSVLGNCLRDKIEDIDVLPEYRRKQYPDSDKTLLDIIEKPEWIPCDCATGIHKDTLIPDVINIVESDDGGIDFLIYDAKYYNIVMAANRVSGQPGIESITKQYLYHMAYESFLQYFGVSSVNNVFLFPIDGGSQRLGRVRLPMLHKITEMDIEAVALNANIVWEKYVNGGRLNLKQEIGQELRY